MRRTLPQSPAVGETSFDPPAVRSASRPSIPYRRRAVYADVIALALATAIVVAIAPTPSPTGPVPAEPLIWSFTFSVMVILLLALRGGYGTPRRLDVLDALRLVLAESALAAIVTMAARIVITNDTFVAAETVRHWGPAVLLLAAGRIAVTWYEGRARVRGMSREPTLVVGAGRIGRLTAARLLDEPELGLEPVAFLDDAPRPADAATAEIPVVGSDRPLDELVQTYGITHVILAFSLTSHDELLSLSRRCWELGLVVAVVPRLFEIEGERVATQFLGGIPLVEMRAADPRGLRMRAKYALDRVIASVAVATLAPLIVLVALGVWISLGPPILFRQRRVGLDGREFDMLKFRTMTDPEMAGALANADWANAQLGGLPIALYEPPDRRLTRVGRLLRRLSLDELPQLFNVVRGEMSLVGPRPELPGYVKKFEPAVYRYAERHRVKSGLTGWAQIHGLRGKTSLPDRVEWDNFYIENWTPWMDVKIIAKTIPAVMRARHE